MRISVLMTTYNRAHPLRLAMASYLCQTEGDFELVVADDGSSDDTAAVVEAFRKEAPFDVTFVTHARDGHRRAAILNKGIAACRHDRILFTDCDSLALADLVAVHRANAEPARLLCGGVVFLTEAETAALTPEDARSGRFEDLLGRRRKIHVWRRHLKARWQILRKTPRRPHNLALNYSVAKDALYRVNGYDEDFTGWGSADGDVRERLRRVGVDPVSLLGSALVLHMWHPGDASKTRAGIAKNRALAKTKRDGPFFCERGLNAR